MANPSKNKGTVGETLAVRWFRVNGFPGADRKALKGNKDCGDLDLCPGVIAEVKNVKLTTGVPAKGQLAEWMRQAREERKNAGADLCPLIVKRPGTQDVGQWFAYLPASELLEESVLRLHPGMWDMPVMVDVATLALLLRAWGYGTTLHEGSALE